VIAEKALPYVAPNPMVGCVIVHNNKIIGEGFHPRYGDNHAEVIAINNVKDHSLLRNSTLYVNLEPCAHHGNTPPCCEFITKHNIPKVIIGSKDTSSKVNGKGIKHLKENGVEIISGVLEEKCNWINRRFITFHQKKRPYIILKWAQSKDGFIDKKRNLNEKGVYWITNKKTKQVVHKWRSEESAILVGRKTIETDNPTLNVREITGPNPIKVIIDPQLKVNAQYNVFNGNTKTIIANSIIEKTHENLIYIKSHSNEILKKINNFLYDQNITSLIVEGGAFTLRSYMKKSLWDECRIISGKSNIIEGTLAPTIDKKPFNEIQLNKYDLLTTYINA